MKIAIICTSPRKHSNSLKVANFFESILKKNEADEITLVDFEDADIPLIGRGELDPDNLSPFQKTLTEAWGAASLVIFVVPEYNWLTGGELINAYHQLGSREFSSLFDNRVFAFAGVSNGKGGRRPGIEMTTMVNKIISVLNGHSIVSPKIFESQYTQDVLEEGGKSKGDASYVKAANGFLAYSRKVAVRWAEGAETK